MHINAIVYREACTAKTLRCTITTLKLWMVMMMAVMMMTMRRWWQRCLWGAQWKAHVSSALATINVTCLSAAMCSDWQTWRECATILALRLRANIGASGVLIQWWQPQNVHRTDWTNCSCTLSRSRSLSGFTQYAPSHSVVGKLANSINLWNCAIIATSARVSGLLLTHTHVVPPLLFRAQTCAI